MIELVLPYNDVKKAEKLVKSLDSEVERICLPSSTKMKILEKVSGEGETYLGIYGTTEEGKKYELFVPGTFKEKRFESIYSNKQ